MILYQLEVTGLPPDLAIQRFFDSFDIGEDLDPPPPFLPKRADDAKPLPVPPESRAYAAELVRGVYREREALDARIQSVSSRWRVDRMARVDRNILRMGAFELLHRAGEVPRTVAINEALEVAKTFGTAESSAFINGLLDRIDGGPR